MLSPHTWLTIGLCCLPLLVPFLRWLLGPDQPPDNALVHEQQDAAWEDPDKAVIELAENATP